VGCTANSAMQITSSPATLAISINHDNYTNQCIAAAGKFAVSILSEQSEPGMIGHFGFQSSRDVNKFDDTPYQLAGGLPVISDSCGYIVCEVIDRMETATHTVFLGEVKEAEVLKGGDAMTYAYYHKVIRGKSPKAAPTYIPEEAETVRTDTPKYVCQVCGYTYEGTDMPDHYKCPICGVGAERFQAQ
jgi:flavin reductase (DIM6/NTAB) family NADH-FMN oxidoreductase RutF/rubredoxin